MAGVFERVAKQLKLLKASSGSECWSLQEFQAGEIDNEGLKLFVDPARDLVSTHTGLGWALFSRKDSKIIRAGTSSVVDIDANSGLFNGPGFVHRTWERWMFPNVGSSGKLLKASFLLNYDPTGPSRLFSVIYDGSIGAASRAMAAIGQLAWQLSRRNLYIDIHEASKDLVDAEFSKTAGNLSSKETSGIRA
ncbi:hypothetical protein Syun_025826 [Stephania yunnanensis]|uniref:Uncharacterized protein n=1 Tax=Stephania yunnanensis TaxID=152371 RepID=A0AAP0ESE7_9MAGN